MAEGWWSSRSCNPPPMESSEDCILSLASMTPIIASTKPMYWVVPSSSRGIYQRSSQLLPIIKLFPEFDQFLINLEQPPAPTEMQLLWEGCYPATATKCLQEPWGKLVTPSLPCWWTTPPSSPQARLPPLLGLAVISQSHQPLQSLNHTVQGLRQYYPLFTSTAL